MAKQIASLTQNALSKIRQTTSKTNQNTLQRLVTGTKIVTPRPHPNAAKPGISKQSDPIGTCTVTCGALNVRSGAGTNYPRIGGLSKGQTVQVYEASNGWLKIAYGSGYGWISQQYTDYKTDEPTQPEQPSTKQGTITAESLNVRTGPGTSYESIGYLHNGDKVTILGESNGWYKIDFNGREAWVSGKYVTVDGGSTSDPVEPEQPPVTGDKVVIIDTASLNVRNGPSADNTKLGSLTHGTKVTVLGESNGWYKINYNGQEGWIKASYTHAVETVDAASQKAVDHAYSLMNTCVNEGWTYSQSLRKQDGHYDCSAFTARCWKAGGYDFSWANSEGQAKKIFNAVGEIEVAKTQPGDLLFYHNDWNSGDRWRGINHVAIAVGGGRRIDAGSTPVKNVASIGSPVMVGRPSKLLT